MRTELLLRVPGERKQIGAHTPDRQVLPDSQAWHAPGLRKKPYGPAGTGKTESVKDLGACLGLQVLVFNCDEGIDFQAMGRIFIDLLRCGVEITVNYNAGIFITMNPAPKGYGGRQKLPDNLKQVFRPVAMSVPGNKLTAKVMMFAEGFKNAKIMAQRIVALCLLSRQLHSMQQHYE